jgi:iron complex outermembrane recepter protein
MKTSRVKSGAVFLLLSTTNISSASAQANATTTGPETQDRASGTPAASGGDMTDIVVTATKRSQRLDQTPLAVSAVTGDALKSKGADSLVDYARSVPGLSFTDIGAGRQRLSIRGIDSKVGFPVVGYYLGESPIPGSRGTIPQTVVDPRLFDIERIEILRGPQGTLYGSGSMGGTVKVVPQRPDLSRIGYEIDATGTSTKANGSSLGYGVNAVINVPIVEDRIGVRVVGWTRDIEGFIERRVNGIAVKKGVPAEKTYGVRGTIDIKLADGWMLSTSAFYQNQKFDGFQDITTGANNPGDQLVQNVGFDVPELNRNKFQLYNALIEGDLGFAKLVSSTSYFKGTQIAQEETSATLDFFLGVPAGDPITESNTNRDFTQEIRLTSNQPIAGFDYLLGIFYNNNRGTRAVDYTISGFSTDFFPVAGDNLFTGRGDYHVRQTAVFGELSYKIAEKITLTAGARWFDAVSSSQEPQNGLFVGNESATAPALSDAPKLTGKSRDVIYKFNASWQVDRDHLLYAQAAQGFRPGIGQAPLPQSLCSNDLLGIGLSNAPRQLNSDTLWNYEIGTKNSFANRKVQVNVSAYQIDWKSIQQAVFLQCGFRVYVNGPNVRNRGIEGEVNVQATPAVRLGATLSYISSKFRQPLLGLAGTQGQPIPDTPKWSASSYVDYRKAIVDGWDATARLDFSYTDGSISAYDGSGSFVKDKGSLSLLDLRIGIQGDRWGMALFAHNIFDDVERTALADSLSANVPTRLRYSVNRPRTFGFNINYRY